MMTKKELRREIKQKRNSISDTDILSLSNRICERVMAYEWYLEASAILAYIPLKGEVDIMPVIFDAITKGKTVAVPRVSGDTMNFYQIKGTADLQPGYMGILEPCENCPLLDIPEALMIMPGCAFDRFLHRCGYGGGFYDRYLEKHPKLRRMAVAFDFQIYDEIPYEDTDINPDILFTETRSMFIMED